MKYRGHGDNSSIPALSPLNLSLASGFHHCFTLDSIRRFIYGPMSRELVCLLTDCVNQQFCKRLSEIKRQHFNEFHILLDSKSVQHCGCVRRCRKKCFRAIQVIVSVPSFVYFEGLNYPLCLKPLCSS